MITGTDNILSWLKNTKAPHWSISSRSDQNSKMAVSSTATIDESVEELKTTLSLFGAGHYLIIAKTTESSTKSGVFKTPIQITDTDRNANTAVSIPVAQGHNDAYVEQRIKEAVEKERLEARLKQLEENGINGVNVPTPFERVATRVLEGLEPLYPYLAQSLTGKPIRNRQRTPVNRVGAVDREQNTQTNEEMADEIELTEEQTTRLNEALATFFTQGGTVEDLEDMAKLIEQNPKTLKKVRMMLDLELDE